jgi:GNAT superfamily N-acetyltransferase
MKIVDRKTATFRVARAEDCLAVAEVNIRSWQESFPDRALQADDLSIERRAAMFQRRFGANFYRMNVAEADGQVIGFVDVGAPRDTRWTCEAELYALYVLKPYQRHGVGQRLFELACEAVIDAGRHSMYLIALSDSPYRTFYERLGALHLASRPTDAVRGQDAHVIYAWPDLQQRRSRSD